MLIPDTVTALLEPASPGVAATFELLDRVDQVLVCGLARLGPAERQALTDLAAALAPTVLGASAADALAKLLTGSADDAGLAALAGARTAALGAVHDALLAQLDGLLHRTRTPWPAPSGTATEATEATGPLTAARAWLQELALIGWRGVDHDIVAGAGQAVAALLADPASRRPAVLLEGLAAELLAGSPTTAAELPVRRWADLWARAVLLAHPSLPAPSPPAEAVSGRLLPLGVDVHEHSTAVQFQVHGILEPADGGPGRLVRWAVSSPKVDTVVGSALWQLFADRPVLLGSLAQGRSIEITELPMLASGDLRWDERAARLADPADPFTTARLFLADAVAASAPPLDRHPVHLAEPVLVEGFSTAVGDDGTLSLGFGDQRLPVDVDRLPTCGPITPQLVAGAESCLGLLRHDGGRWLLQPLAVRTTLRRKPVMISTGDWALGPTDPKVAKAAAKTGDAVTVLRERAGRLLRP